MKGFTKKTGLYILVILLILFLGVSIYYWCNMNNKEGFIQSNLYDLRSVFVDFPNNTKSPSLTQPPTSINMSNYIQNSTTISENDKLQLNHHIQTIDFELANIIGKYCNQQFICQKIPQIELTNVTNMIIYDPSNPTNDSLFNYIETSQMQQDDKNNLYMFIYKANKKMKRLLSKCRQNSCI